MYVFLCMIFGIQKVSKNANTIFERNQKQHLEIGLKECVEGWWLLFNS